MTHRKALAAAILSFPQLIVRLRAHHLGYQSEVPTAL
jgi:hypothetical protein